jgi:hypothetical protein
MSNEAAAGPSQSTDGASFRVFAPAAYLTALAMLGPLISTQIGVWDSPLVSTTSWRYGVFGLIVGNQFYLMVALGLVAAAATARLHRAALLVVTVISVMMCLFLLVGMPLFLLDTLQLRKGMAPGMFLRVRQGAALGMAQAVLGLPVFVVMAVASWKAWRTIASTRADRSRTPSPRIVGGT